MGRAGAERALISFINSLPREEYDISLLSLINRGETFDEVITDYPKLTESEIADLRKTILGE